ncbi:hypothetical protein [Ramlibacter sp. WS9]|uniref:hypothetical protein n=1 Tax=Ramlibacter sp. WS9 TaxID=1882741 RepID=UPI001144CCE9|nr:hypothetical protein [Ramlibacter sp. WS9]ROZ63392.1 hypothetical protein EEB15_29720 [Ramlibacter sp. WS9]
MLAVTLMVGIVLPAAAQNVMTLNTVAVAGKQRMLSQRVLKAYAQLSLSVGPDKAASILSTSLEELRSSNGALRAMARDANGAALHAQAMLIDKLATITATQPTASSLQQATLVSEELLANAEAVTQAFIKSGAEAPAAMVNLAARQRMLSQRAAAAYFVYQTAAKSHELKTRAMKAASEFKAAIIAFDDARTEFPQISDRVDMARMQMVFFDNALSNIDNPTKEQFATIAATSERILSEMDAMTSEIVKQIATRNVLPATASAKRK